MSKWIAEFELEDGDKMPEHMDLEYHGVKLDFHCRPIEKTYEDGLNEAWELARDIITLPNSGNKNLTWVRHNVFGTDALFDLIINYSASEIIEKIKKYEEIEVGDEVVDEKGWGIKGVVTKTNERYISIVEKEGKVSRFKKGVFNKTGRHFPQIEEVLQQMQKGKE